MSHDARQPLSRSEAPATSANTKRYGVCGRTIIRWEADARLGFPQAVLINGRKCDDLDAPRRMGSDDGRTAAPPMSAAGHTDSELVNAMTSATAMLDPIGSRTRAPGPRVSATKE